MRYLSTHKGITLLETLIYIAIVAVVFSVMIGSLVIVVRVYEQTATTRSINSSASLSLERISRDIRAASSVDQAGSILGTNPGKLVLVAGPTTTEFYISNGAIWFKENGVAKYALTQNLVTTTNLIFRYISTGNSAAVKVEMTFQSGTGTAFRSEKFYNTAVLRNSY